MKKLLKSPQTLVRRVLSRTSNISKSSSSNDPKMKKKQLMTEERLGLEIETLREQVQHLKAAINKLKEDTEKKEVAIGKLAKEKEAIAMQLLKQKRSNNDLLHQLEDERKFYYKEKEQYCQEMNQFKRLKQVLSSASVKKDVDLPVEVYKKEITTLKQTLNQTLEANYNLSIKFLRMKNTKTCLKTELKTMKLEHEKLINDYKTIIHNLSEELNDLIQERLNTPISCSSKKYLNLVKQNSCLVYENLCLQLEVDNLRLKCEKLRLEKAKSESNSKLKYIKQDAKSKASKKEHKRVRIKDETPEKLERVMPSTSKKEANEEIVKIFERHELPGIPDIKMSKDFNEATTSQNMQPPQIPNVQEPLNKSKLIEDVLEKPTSKLALFQISNFSSKTSTHCGSLVRVHSSPEIAIRFSPS